MLVGGGEAGVWVCAGCVVGQRNWERGRATNGDTVMLVNVVDEGGGYVVWFGDGEYQFEIGSAQAGSRGADQGQRDTPGARTPKC